MVGEAEGRGPISSRGLSGPPVSQHRLRETAELKKNFSTRGDMKISKGMFHRTLAQGCELMLFQRPCGPGRSGDSGLGHVSSSLSAQDLSGS